MDQFFHIRMLVSMIVSLSMAHLLKGVAKIIEHPKRKEIYWVHLLWVFYMFIQIIDFWWWEFRLKRVIGWNFGSYCFIILYIVLFYIICSLAFPDDMSDYQSYKDYFYKRKHWFFSFLAAIFLVDIGDTLLKGTEYFKSLGTEYIVRNVVHIVLFLIAARSKNERFQMILVVVALLYSVSWILRKYLFFE